MSKILKKSSSVLLAVLMAVSVFTISAGAAAEITYIDRTWDSGQKQVVETSCTTSSYTTLSSSVRELSTGFYVLSSNVTYSDTLKVNSGADVKIILCDGKKLKVEEDGIEIPSGSTLTFYGQSGGTGVVDSYNEDGAGIGSHDKASCGTINIKGGNITAKGGNKDAGIGGGKMANGGTVNIYGGTVTATGGHYGAGIGGGDRDDSTGGDSGNITIYGGTVTATGGDDGAGIGGGEGGKADTITIHSGTVTATGGNNSAGIGGGENDTGHAVGGTITINDGNITATGGSDGAGIGGGDEGNCTITINGGEIHAKGGTDGAGIGGGTDADGGSTTINGGKIYTLFRDGAGIGGGESGDGGTIRITGGEIHCDPDEGSEGNGAAIGGGYHDGAGGSITITDGEIYATSIWGAAIGGGCARPPKTIYLVWFADKTVYNSGDAGTINISGGEIHATSKEAIGIGAGGPGEPSDGKMNPAEIGSAGNITIGGDAVVDVQGHLAGMGGDSGKINITGGNLTSGGYSGNGYGIDLDDDSAQLNISGGESHFNGINGHPGIFILYGSANITGGKVYSNSSIGKGYGVAGYKTAGLTVKGQGTYFSSISEGAAAIANIGISYFGDGAVIETKSGSVEKCLPTYYAESRVTAGSDKEHAAVLNANDRATANSTYKYVLVEPCDHNGTMTGGRCTACGWTAGSYHVTFDSDGGSEVMSQMTGNSAYAVRPDDPTKDGYVFVNWYKVESGNLVSEPFDFEHTVITGDITLKAVWECTWVNLQNRIDNASNGSTIQLDKDYYAHDDDSALTIPSGKTLTLDLNGHKIDRALEEAKVNGNVITNNGTLTIIDSSEEQTGKITGGFNNNGTGGAVRNESGAVLTLNGGNLTGNKASNGGAGIFNKGTVTINGGTISDNYVSGVGKNGGGIWTDNALTITGGAIKNNRSKTGNGGGISFNNGSLNISGSLKIMGNIASSHDNDLFIWNNDHPDLTVTVSGALDEKAVIGVREKNNDSTPFTNGLSGNGNVSNFFSDDENYLVRLNNSGEAILNRTYAVTVDNTNGGTVEADVETACEGETVNLTVTPDTGYKIGSVMYNDGSDHTITPDGDSYSLTMPAADVTVTAVFTEIVTYTKVDAVSADVFTSGNIEYYAGSDGKLYTKDGDVYTEVTQAQVETPALIDKAITAGGDDYIASSNPVLAKSYIGGRFLGFQKEALNGEETKTNSLRFVTEISSEILEKLNSDEHADYGYVFALVKVDGDADYNNLTVDNTKARVYSCKDTTNTVSGKYGNKVFTDGEGYTEYKYITAAVNDINTNAKMAARFYITYNGTTRYISYKNADETGFVFSTADYFG